ncbi:uncharacterized protein M421DRAFT_12953, partial [Didymella exigua CBS 183.55]
MELPPLSVILSWPLPNYNDPVTRGNALVIANAIFLTLVLIVVSLRLYCRLAVRIWFGPDDLFILAALFFTICLTAVVILANEHFGWNKHIWDIPLESLSSSLKIGLVAKIAYIWAASCTRLSLHFFYYRLTGGANKPWFKWLVHANVALTVSILITVTFVSIFACHPVSDYWKIGSAPGTCLDEGASGLGSGIVNCIADFTTWLTPIPLVIGLQMPLRQRISIIALFALGIIVTIIGIVRTWFIYKAILTADITWHTYPLWIAAAVEIDLGVICASAPVLRPLI